MRLVHLTGQRSHGLQLGRNIITFEGGQSSAAEVHLYNYRFAHVWSCLMAIYQLDDLSPVVPDSAYVADNATVLGDVRLGENSSVWFGAVLRGDSATITLGANSNVQDNSVLHADEGIPLTIGENVTIGHQVMLHGCTIGDGTLVGIGAVVLNNARIGRNCLVGAGALVTEGKEFPDGSVIMGSPGKVVRELTPQQITAMQGAAGHYVKNGLRFKAGLSRLA
jgi:carbonic anhydrase/acetyltransferase-like protein (isoleucine patch superfamily)